MTLNPKNWSLSILSACALISIPSAAGAASLSSTPLTVSPHKAPQSIYEYALTASTADYNAECAEKVGQNGLHQNYVGNLTIDTPTDVEVYRCLQSVSGDLTLDSPDSKGLTLPWLRTIDGDLELIGNYNLDDARLPRLHRVSGRIIVDAWNGLATRWEAYSLKKHAGRFEVESGTTTDLRGFDALEDIGTLAIDLRSVHHPQNPQFPNFEGLAGLISVGRLDLDTGAEEVTQEPDFLSNLIEVRGNATLRTESYLIGTQAIESVGGTLDISVSTYFGGARADGLESLAYVGQDFEWSGTELNNINALANLEYVGGDLVLPLYVSSIAGLSALEEVGGDFALEGGINVADLSPLSSLERVGGRLSIEDSGIGSLNGLQDVQYLGGLTISDNYSLSSVSALNNAQVGAFSSVIITYNSPLTHCAASNLISAMSIDPTTTTTNTGNQSCYSFKRVGGFGSF